MTFWGKPDKIDYITYLGENPIEIPESILEEGEYMIFHTKQTYSIGSIRAVFWILLSSKGRLFTCEYKSKNFEILDKIVVHDIEQAFICNGWLLILEKLDYSGCLDNSGCLVINRSWQLGGSNFAPLITLLKTYTQLFPDTIINSHNKDQDKFFRIKSGEEAKRILKDMEKLLEDSPRPKSSVDDKSFKKARRELKKMLEKSLTVKGLLKKRKKPSRKNKSKRRTRMKR
jgi:hypothetical protein